MKPRQLGLGVTMVRGCRADKQADLRWRGDPVNSVNTRKRARRRGPRKPEHTSSGMTGVVMQQQHRPDSPSHVVSL